MTAPALPSSRPVVLLVDDEREIRVVLELGLKDHFDVETAGSTNEAELMLATRTYDVVVCDHLMPDEEGLTFLIRAQQRFPDMRRILLTGYFNPELISRSTHVAKLSACLMKPLRAAELAAAIRQALAS
jgi:two-component system response regulator HupR/HoxA